MNVPVCQYFADCVFALQGFQVRVGVMCVNDSCWGGAMTDWLTNAPPFATWQVTIASSDSATSNRLLMRHVEATQNSEHHLVLASYCCQHRCGTVVEGLTNMLDVLSPSYCMATSFLDVGYASKIHHSLRSHLMANLVIQQHEPSAISDDRKFATDLLRYCLGHLEPADHETNLRSPKADALIAKIWSFFPCSWRGLEMIHFRHKNPTWQSNLFALFVCPPLLSKKNLAWMQFFRQM